MSDENNGEIINVTLPHAYSKSEAERQAFQQLLPELLKTHRGQYVAIHRGEVVGAGPEELPLRRQVREAFGGVAIHVGLVTEQPSGPLPIPGFRVIR
jgi:hypothetical protein